MTVHLNLDVLLSWRLFLVQQLEEKAIRYVLTDQNPNGTSPLWTQSCTTCGAYRGDPCRPGRPPEGHEFCLSRVQAAAQALIDLPTWAVPIRTPCCNKEVWLLWRGVSTQMAWTGVACPAPGCETTYSIEKDVSQFKEQRQATARIYPWLLEMTCAALNPIVVEETPA